MEFPDAPLNVGKVFVRAVKSRNASLLNSLLTLPFCWGVYTEKLSSDERRWINDNIVEFDDEFLERLPTLREDVEVKIETGQLRDFEAGKSIEKHLPIRWKLQTGDRILWRRGGLSGVAQIVALFNDLALDDLCLACDVPTWKCRLEKIS